MANHASAKKRARQTLRRTLRNRHVRTTMRTQVKRLRETIAAKRSGDAQSLLRQVTALIDGAASKGVLHRRTAARYVSRLATQVAALTKTPAA